MTHSKTRHVGEGCDSERLKTQSHDGSLAEGTSMKRPMKGQNRNDQFLYGKWGPAQREWMVEED